MTVPWGAVAAGLVPVVDGLTALREWTGLMDSLAVQVAKLSAAVDGKRGAEVAQLRPAVESVLSLASKAAGVVGSLKVPVPADVQQRWVSVLTRAQSALKNAESMIGRSQVTVGASLLPVPVSTEGWRIPFTNIVMPWSAVIGILAVAGVGLYFSRKRS